MSILQMSFFSALIIIAIILIRATTINKLPKKTFLVLWGVAALRLIVPFKIESMISVYSLFTSPESTPIQNNINNIMLNNLPLINQSISPNRDTLAPIVDNSISISPYVFLWVVGVILCSAFFIVSYLKCKKEFNTSLPISNEYINNLISEKKIKRSIQIRQSSCITAPLTYGILKPVILLPKSIDLDKRKQLEYIINHEYVHIKRFDGISKFLMSAILCIHWFNPLVWVMYVMLNRDIEISCDEAVVRILGESSRSEYALTLIDMKEKQNATSLPHSTLYTSFSKTAIEERIRAIMKYKKTSVIAIIFAVALVAIVTIFLATSAKDKDAIPPINNNVNNTSVEKLDKSSLDIIKTEWDNSLKAYQPLGITYKLNEYDGQAKLYWNNEEIRGIYNPSNGEWISNSAGNTTFTPDVKGLIAVYENDKISSLRYATEQEQADWTKLRSQNSSVIPEREESGTIDDYKSLLKLKTNNYKQMSVSDFNNILLNWCNENFLASERISHDIAFNDFQVKLTDDELAFVKFTFNLSRIENSELITSERTGNPLQDPIVGEVRLDDEKTTDKWSYYQFSYHINDNEKLTIAERDSSIIGVMNDIQTFWNSIKETKIYSISRNEVIADLNSIIKKFNNDNISIKLIQDRTRFEAMNNSNASVEPLGTVTFDSVQLMHYDDGSPYLHDIITSNTGKTITEYEYVMLAYDKNGKALKLKWQPYDSGAVASYDNIVKLETEILPNTTEDIPGGWSLTSKAGERTDVAYSLYTIKQITFKDGTVWNNPNYENWIKTFQAKDISIEMLKKYYPFSIPIYNKDIS